MTSLTDIAAKKQAVDATAPAPTPLQTGPAIKLNLGQPESLMIADLDALAADIPASNAEPQAQALSQFQDQVPVATPTRKPPEELDAQQQAFVGMLDSVYTLQHDPEAIKNAVERIMIDMRETPHLANLLEDDDVMIIVRRMKDILGFRKAVKAAKPKAKRKASAAVSEMTSMIDDLLGDISL